MADDNVTMAVLGQRMDQLLSQFTQLNSRLDADRSHNNETFARKDVLGPTLQTISNRAEEINTDVVNLERSVNAKFDKIDERHKGQETKNRQYALAIISVAGGLLVAVLMWLITGQGGVA